MSKRHWAYTYAEVLSQRSPKNGDVYTLQTSMTPSGPLHIGNFRDTLTAWAVQSFLNKMGKKTRLLLSFDDADEDKKARTPLCYSTKDGKWPAKRHAAHYLRELGEVGFQVDEVVYQSSRYFESSSYRASISRILRKRRMIAGILNRFKETPLDKNWHPLVVFCGGCKKKVVDPRLGWLQGVSYRCPCQEKSKRALKKLVWRLDWPMRVHSEGIDFEPCGSDHACYGSTMTTSEAILREVLGSEMPVIARHGFLRVAGQGVKMSSSKGNTLTLSDLLSILPRSTLLWWYLKQPLGSDLVLDIEGGYLTILEDYRRFQLRLSQGKASRWELDIAELLGKPTAVMAPDPKQLRRKCISRIASGMQPEGQWEGRMMCWLRNYAPPKFQIQRAAWDNLSSGNVALLQRRAAGYRLSRQDFKHIYCDLFGKDSGPSLASLLGDSEHRLGLSEERVEYG